MNCIHPLSGVSIDDTYHMFSNKYLDELFKPQWEKYGVQLRNNEVPNGVNGVTNGEEINGNQEKSACCEIMWFMQNIAFIIMDCNHWV